MSEISKDLASELARLTLRLEDLRSLDAVASALDDGRLTRTSGTVAISSVAGGRLGVPELVEQLRSLWNLQPKTVEAYALALMLRGAAAGARVQRALGATTEVVWTGPQPEGVYLRATRQVVQDIIYHAQANLLVVGYWVAGRGDGEGVVRDIVDMIADAVRRGVSVTMVLDQKEREHGLDHGRTNRDILVGMWPEAVRLPTLLTWQIPKDEKHLKLHAKVLVADRHDALVTSANLTMHALDKNMEMGVRVLGHPAQEIVRHFELLQQRNELVPFP